MRKVIIPLICLMLLFSAGCKENQEKTLNEKESKAMVMNYYQEVNALFGELNRKYDEMKNAVFNEKEWESFTKEWMAKEIRLSQKYESEELFGKYEGIRSGIFEAKKDLLELWADYDKAVRGKGDEDEAEGTRRNIEIFLEEIGKSLKE